MFSDKQKLNDNDDDDDDEEDKMMITITMRTKMVFPLQRQRMSLPSNSEIQTAAASFLQVHAGTWTGFLGPYTSLIDGPPSRSQYITTHSKPPPLLVFC